MSMVSWTERQYPRGTPGEVTTHSRSYGVPLGYGEELQRGLSVQIASAIGDLESAIGIILASAAAIISGLFSTGLLANEYYPKPREHWYQDVWCRGKGGQVEFKLKDGRRVDCLTDRYAIEVEFARKWSEAIGQSLDYSMLTGKKAGIVLILQRDSDHIYWNRIQSLKDHYQLPITLWKLGP